MQAVSTHCFLGANTPDGFYSLYDQLMTENQSVYILKGGPGCGKSSFMKQVAQRLNEPTEYIHCSGDPDSLDAVRFPRRSTVLVDGTAPHIIEPRYPGVLDHYINLGSCYDAKRLAPLQAEILTCTDRYRAQSQRAYRILSAACRMSDPLPACALSPAAVARMKRRIRLIAGREFKKADQPGTLSLRFLGGVTHQGIVCRFDTADALCSRVIVCTDSYGLADSALQFLKTAALEAGYDVIACPSPLDPNRLEHLLIPACSLAFLTATDALPYPGKPVRKLRFDGLLAPDWLRENRARLRFEKKITRLLLQDAVSAFGEAKRLHDTLETLYNEHVCFETVYEAADQLADLLLEK